MYEAILGRIDAVLDFLSLAQEDRRIRPGVNPWGYSGGGNNRTNEKETLNPKQHNGCGKGGGHAYIKVMPTGQTYDSKGSSPIILDFEYLGLTDSDPQIHLFQASWR